MRLSALEQPGEQHAEMAIDLLESGTQPLAPLAVEIADRTAQPVDRLEEFRLFACAGPMFSFDPRQLLRCDEVDRTDPLAAGNQLVHRLRFRTRIAPCFGGKAKPLGQQWRRALDSLPTTPRPPAAPRRPLFLPPRHPTRQ